VSWLITLPVVLPIGTAVLTFLFRKARPLAHWLSVAGCVALLICAIALLVQVWRVGIVVAHLGDWPAPFGITLAADLLAAVMLLLTAVIGLAVALYAMADIDARLETLGYHALFHVLLAGVCGAFVAGDLFNLYVWFEVMLIASFGLLVLGGSKAQIDGGIKYVALNLVSTVLFLSGIGLLYGLTGTLNLADLHRAVGEVNNQGLVTVVAVLFMVAFGIKAAVFPLFFWLPASYHTAPVVVSAVFAGLLTKVGVYALIRMYTLVFTHDTDYTHALLLVIAGLTMVTGVLGAAAQNEFRKILSFHIVSQIGYIVMGLALFTPLALAGAVLFLAHNIIAKANLFLVSGIATRLSGHSELAASGGLYKSAPFLAILFLVPALALAGIPPLSGFWAKFLLVKASLDASAYVMAATALVVGLLTLFSMTKIWGEAFWKAHPDDAARSLKSLEPRERALLVLPVTGLAGLTIVIGVFPEPFVIFAERAAAQLLDPATYVQAVLGPAS